MSTDLATTAARELTDKIKVAVEFAWDLVTEAYTTRAWAVLGYGSWDDYCVAEFGGSRLQLPREERRVISGSLREAGLSIRAIAAATGDGVATVHRDLAGVPNGTPDAEPPKSFRISREPGRGIPAPQTPPGRVETTEPEPPKVTGVDGKSYPAARQPKPAAPAEHPLAVSKAAMDVAKTSPWAVFTTKIMPEIARCKEWAAFSVDDYNLVIDAHINEARSHLKAAVALAKQCNSVHGTQLVIPKLELPA
jgi:hypothetical protein